MTMTKINDSNTVDNKGEEEMTTVTATQVAEVNSKLNEIVQKSNVIQEHAERIQVQADSALEIAQHYKDFSHNFCRQLLHELIQKHVYNATYSDEYKALTSQRNDNELKLCKCTDEKESKELVLQQCILNNKIESLLVNAVYLGALHDQYMLPETMEKLQNKFSVDNGDLNPFEDLRVLDTNLI